MTRAVYTEVSVLWKKHHLMQAAGHTEKLMTVCLLNCMVLTFQKTTTFQRISLLVFLPQETTRIRVLMTDFPRVISDMLAADDAGVLHLGALLPKQSVV
jgi:hypothetical protein